MMSLLRHPTPVEALPRPRWTRAVLGAAASLLALGGCDGATPQTADPTTDAPFVTPTGMSLQGMSLQGMNLQGMSLQGMSLQGMSLQGMSLQGMSLQGTSFQGTDLGGNPVALGPGSVLTTTDGSGVTVTLRVANVQKDWQDATGETTLYAIEALDAKGQWQNVCGVDTWGEQWAIPVSGSWSATGAHVDTPGTFTFGCTSGVVAKCVRWGYKPWKSVNGVSLAAHHQACTRMARADYCGNGVSHTRNGTMIDMYDTIGIQKSESGIDFFFEAAWTPEGAYCVSKERWNGISADGLTSTSSVLNQSCEKKLDRLDPSTLVTGDFCMVKIQPSLKDGVLLYNRSRINFAPPL